MHWPSKLEALQELDQAQAFAQLAHELRDLPPTPPADAEPLLAYWRGKCALLDQNFDSAVVWLSRSLVLQPHRVHALYLLGVVLVRQQRWLDAVSVLERATQLDPTFHSAALELADAYLALGCNNEAQQALEALVVIPGQSSSARSAYWQARIRGQPLAEGPHHIRAALAMRSGRLADELLLEWLHTATGLLLAGEWRVAQEWFAALATPTPSLEACSHPLPRRPALLMALVAALLQGSDQAHAWAAELRGALWLPPADLEQQLWQPLVVPVMRLLIGRWPSTSSWDLFEGALAVLADALHAIDAPGSTEAIDLARQLRQPVRAAAPDPLEQLGALGADLPAHLELWPQILGLADADLLKARRELDQGLLQLSALLLDRPNRLVIHPDPAALGLAMRLRREGLTLLEAAHARLDQLLPPVPLHQRPRRRWLLLASDDLPQCWLYRVEQKQQHLEALGCECRILRREELDTWDWSEQLLWADALMVCRLPALHPVLRAIHSARRAGLPVYYDLDDLLFDPQHCPPNLSTYGGTLNPELHRRFQLDVPLFAAAIRACDGLVVSTTTLADRWRELFGADQPALPVWVLPNLAPPALRGALQPPKPLALAPLRLVLASGTTAHKQAWHQELAPALAALLERYSHVELHLLGHVQVPLVLVPYAARIRCSPYTDYPRYLQQLGRAHIGLVVLEEGVFTDAKSAIRWMEFSYLGLASVLSPTATYTEILEPGCHALFARGTSEWISQIERLIHDPALRMQLACQAQEHAQRLFGFHQVETLWRPLLDPPGMSALPPRPKLLVPHVFFAPQSLGGATRVVQDQVLALIRHAPQHYDVTVLCTDAFPWQLPEAPPHESPEEPWSELAPIPVEVHSWHGARVVRLSLPPRNWREHHDCSVERLCTWWLAQEAFDLIHAHCMQVLSVAPLQVAKTLGIPYAITIHDGWWLSPRQFLTTASGAPVDPQDPLSHFDVPELFPSAVLERDRQRRAVLEQVLNQAAVRLAVSESFAELHRRAGISAMDVLVNHWQPMPPSQPPQARPSDQPLRACFVGGLSLHKGLAVLHCALLMAQLPPPGMQLTLVDASLEPGDTYSLQWGSVPVRVVPPIPMQEMVGFYAEHDLLLAPSIWPESYGLVTREALSAGLWVVASDAGALAEPIRHGVNGHVVPPGDPAALATVLEHLSGHHPTPQPLLAFNTGQPTLIQEIEQIYRRVLTGP